MLFQAISQIQRDPLGGIITLLIFILALVIAISFHEFSHALAATRLGDPTPRRQGRLSLHPLSHLDPMGTAMILFAGFGWGKPVQVYPGNLSIGPRSGMAAVSLAGPASNLLMATLFAIPIRAEIVPLRIGVFPSGGDVLAYLIGALVFWNLLLAAFNLLPISPLDGFKVALGVLPRNMAYSFARLEPYGPIILVLIIMFDLLMPGPGILSSIIRPIMNLLGLVVLGRQLF